jgi:hypothetical protein
VVTARLVSAFGPSRSKTRSAELLAGIGAVVDTAGGSFTMHFTAVAVTAARY